MTRMMIKNTAIHIYNCSTVPAEQPIARIDRSCEREYSGNLLNEHPSTADTHDIMDNSESPDCPSIHFNTQATPE